MLTIAVSLKPPPGRLHHGGRMKTMWEPCAGRVTKWNQIHSTWPDQPLKLFGAGSDSGTFITLQGAVVGKPNQAGATLRPVKTTIRGQGIANANRRSATFPCLLRAEQKRLKAVSIDGDSRAGESVARDGQQLLPAAVVVVYLCERKVIRSEVKRTCLSVASPGAGSASQICAAASASLCAGRWQFKWTTRNRVSRAQRSG